MKLSARIVRAPLAATCALLGAFVFAQERPETAQPTPGAFTPYAAVADEPAEPNIFFYWSGASHSPLRLALDELRLVAEADLAEPPRLEAIMASSSKIAWAEPVSEAPLILDVRLKRIENLEALNAVAADIESALPGISALAIAYPPHDPATPEAKRIITRRLSLKLKPSQDFETLAQERGWLLKETISYSPQTYIVEAPRSGGLLAAIHESNALRELNLVEFSDPEIFRRATLKEETETPQALALPQRGPSRRGKTPQTPEPSQESPSQDRTSRNAPAERP
jgi:hypothetical protein